MADNNKRSSFPPVFWIANGVEVLERFAYYGIYMGFGIYLQQLGYSRGDLGIIQSIFLAFSYLIPLFSGTFADRFGFKKMLIVSYLAYLPAILLLIITETFSGIAITMLTIGFAAGIFKQPDIARLQHIADLDGRGLAFGLRPFHAVVDDGCRLAVAQTDFCFLRARFQHDGDFEIARARRRGNAAQLRLPVIQFFDFGNRLAVQAVALVVFDQPVAQGFFRDLLIFGDHRRIGDHAAFVEALVAVKIFQAAAHFLYEIAH